MEPFLYSPLHKGDDDNNNNNNVDGTDGAMIALTLERIAEAFNAGVQFPLGTLVPTKPFVECFPMGGGGQTIMSIDLTIST